MKAQFQGEKMSTTGKIYPFPFRERSTKIEQLVNFLKDKGFDITNDLMSEKRV